MNLPHLRFGVAMALLFAATSSFALNTATIVASALSPSCLEYRVVGICYWLSCSASGCRIRTSIKVRHYVRSEEHTSELQSLLRISYAVFCLKKKNTKQNNCNQYLPYTQI